MTKIKNVSDGPKVVNAQPPYVLQPGEEHSDFVISDGDKVAASRTGWFEIDGTTDLLDHDGDGRKGGSVPPAGEPASTQDIITAIGLLEPGNDAHWTAAGLPSVEAVTGLLPGKAVTRKAIEEAAPDAKRPTA